MFKTVIKILVLSSTVAIATPALAQKATDDRICMADSCETELRKLKKMTRWGSGYAATIVAMAYASGDGVEQNNEEAVRYLTKAVHYRDAFATYLMSDWLSRGFMVEKDETKAAELLSKAVKADFPPAQYTLAVKLLQSDTVEDQSTGLKLLQKAADARLADAMYLLARLKHTSAGVPQDLAGAGELYKRLALIGYPKSQQFLDDVVEQLSAQQGETELVADFRAVKDIEVITVNGSREASFNMLQSVVRVLQNTGLYEGGSMFRIRGVNCENSGMYCVSVKPDNRSKSISQVLSGGI